MNTKDAIIAKKKKKGERLENGHVHYSEQGPRPKKAKVGEKRDRDGKKAGSSSGRYPNYTPLNTSLDQVLMQIKKIHPWSGQKEWREIVTPHNFDTNLIIIRKL